ncbi:CGNR zinc finger domain-containing protein [Bordetella petrii]|uniref:CGNR zinc finger domain-containing protein n=1 Tax=Bordetella petrii TaxID=94624 RepID=UPI001E647322|nr:CGNR zinc finger domain-containing protein [Bordetella petrii]MCD0505490.1 CGNR zinc finger domain-containing protein [Bordetella petrii]
MPNDEPDTSGTPDTFVGGHPYLDFLNTGGGPTKARDAPAFADWAEALRWLSLAGVVTPAERRQLAKLAQGPAALAALKNLVSQREHAHAVLSAVAGDQPAPPAARRYLENEIRLALKHATLPLFPERQPSWHIDRAAAGLDLPRLRLALSAQDLVAHAPLHRLRECEACSWLFLDTSRGGRRRWCSMATCGNRAKAPRHYRAQQAA